MRTDNRASLLQDSAESLREWHTQTLSFPTWYRLLAALYPCPHHSLGLALPSPAATTDRCHGDACKKRTISETSLGLVLLQPLAQGLAELGAMSL